MFFTYTFLNFDVYYNVMDACQVFNFYLFHRNKQNTFLVIFMRKNHVETSKFRRGKLPLQDCDFNKLSTV